MNNNLKNVERVSLEKEETFYCEKCKENIPVEHLDDGYVVIRCPLCVGECMTCDCHLVQSCFSDAPLIRVIHTTKSK